MKRVVLTQLHAWQRIPNLLSMNPAKHQANNKKPSSQTTTNKTLNRQT